MLFRKTIRNEDGGDEDDNDNEDGDDHVYAVM